MNYTRSLLVVLLVLLAAYGVYPHLKRLMVRPKGLLQAELTTLGISSQLHPGDLIFHTSQSAKSQAIQLATHSSYSHCGILLRQGGEWQVLEAIQPVSITPLEQWIARGKGRHFVVKRLRDADQVLTPTAVRRLIRTGRRYWGKPYDLYFGWSDDRIYCSELIWKVYERGIGRRLGRLQHLRDFDLRHPAVRAKLRERYGDHLPLNETVISPVSIFRSPELVTVLSR